MLSTLRVELARMILPLKQMQTSLKGVTAAESTERRQAVVEVVVGVVVDVEERDLGPREDDRLGEAADEEGHGGGAVLHGVGAVDDHEAVVGAEVGGEGLVDVDDEVRAHFGAVDEGVQLDHRVVELDRTEGAAHDDVAAAFLVGVLVEHREQLELGAERLAPVDAADGAAVGAHPEGAAGVEDEQPPRHALLEVAVDLLAGPFEVDGLGHVRGQAARVHFKARVVH